MHKNESPTTVPGYKTVLSATMQMWPPVTALHIKCDSILGHPYFVQVLTVKKKINFTLLEVLDENQKKSSLPWP